jgi:hypothetical protein
MQLGVLHLLVKPVGKAGAEIGSPVDEWGWETGALRMA